MKKIFGVLLIFVLLLTINVKADIEIKRVDTSEKIYDFSDILTDNEEIELKRIMNNYIANTNFDLVIVTDDVPYTNDSDNEIYTEKFYEYNNFGNKNMYHDGIILFRNTYSENPYYMMLVYGKAQLYYSPVIDDILDEIYSDIKNRNYKEAFIGFINQLNYYYNRGISDEMKDYQLDETGHLKKVEKEEIKKNDNIRDKTIDELVEEEKEEINNRKSIFQRPLFLLLIIIASVSVIGGIIAVVIFRKIDKKEEVHNE